MIVVLPIAGEIFFKNEEYVFPKPLIDIKGKPLIQYVIEGLSSIQGVTRYVFVVKEELCSKYNLDYTLRLLTKNTEIIKIKSDTKGAVCSILLAIDKIKEDEEVLIVNSDQVFKTDLEKPLSFFRDEEVGAGVITFDSIHPRWSYVLTKESNDVFQAAEKKPISRNAIAGFYYFNKFSTFYNAAYRSLLTEDTFNSSIYVSSVVNQVILQNQIVKHYQIQNDEFVTFYSSQKLKEFEKVAG